MSYLRTRWAALGAAVAVTLGAGGIGISHATLGAGERTAFVPITPCRLADTRPAPFNRGPRLGPLGAAATFTITATGAKVGDCTITSGATGVGLNVTALNQTQLTFLTIYPTGSTRPETSNLNPSPGQPHTPNAVTVDLNGSGQFDIYNLQGSVDVIVDVVGYYEDHHHDDRYYTKDQVYNKTAVDSALTAKANTTSVYTKTEIDAWVEANAAKASFAASTANSALTASYVEVARLSGAGAGGTISISSPARLLLTGAVTINENGGTGQDSQSRCKFQWAFNGGAWNDVGKQQFAEAEGNSNHDEKVSIALATGFEVTPGTHDIRIVCAASLFSGAPAIESGDLTVLAVH